jgi:hypothetical protein
MARKIKYETTTIAPEDSAAQIGKLVSNYGARQFSQHWAPSGFLEGVTFLLVDHRYGGIVPIRLQAQTDAILEILESGRKRPARVDLELQAQRIAWRQLKDLVEQLLLAARTGLFSVVDAFMANVVIETPDGDSETVGEFFARAEPELGKSGLKLFKALPAGSK